MKFSKLISRWALGSLMMMATHFVFSGMSPDAVLMINVPISALVLFVTIWIICKILSALEDRGNARWEKNRKSK